MKELIKLYKFKTPFFDEEKEKKQFKHLITKINIFLKDIWLNDLKETNIKNAIIYNSNNFKLEFIYNITDSDIPYLPFLYIWVNYNWEEKTKLNLTDFVSMYLDNVDIINNYDLIVDSDYFSDKKNEFISSDKIQKESINNTISKDIEKFLKDKSFNFKKVKTSFLLFNYIIFELYKNIVKTSNHFKDIKNTIETDSKNTELQKILYIQSQRLEHIQELNTTNFKKYLEILLNFNELVKLKKIKN